MALSAAQLSTLKTNIAANTATVSIGGNSVQIKNVPAGNDNDVAVADWYNQPAGTDFFGNYKNVPLTDIKGAITHKNYTPTDTPPASGATVQISNDLLLYTARMLFGQSFQMEINNLLLAGTTFDATNSSLVAALKDATNTDMPLGASGANQKGGWGGASGVQTKLCRKGTNAEKVFATVVPVSADGSTNLKAATYTFEGALTGTDIENSRSAA